jgi:putative Holliday junction resolvase
MALDVGKVRIGVAITDGLGLTAQPLLTIWCKNRSEDLRNVVRLIKRHEVGHVIVGNPLRMDGETGAWARRVQEFTTLLEQKSGVPVELVDERLTSVAAEEILNRAGVKGQDRKPILDQVAAVVLLEGWMQNREQVAARALLDME